MCREAAACSGEDEDRCASSVASAPSGFIPPLGVHSSPLASISSATSAVLNLFCLSRSTIDVDIWVKSIEASCLDITVELANEFELSTLLLTSSSVSSAFAVTHY